MTEDRRARMAASFAAWRAAGSPKKEKTGLKHTIRTFTSTVEMVGYTPQKAIKHMCSECFMWEGNPKKECSDSMCPLYPFRGRKMINGKG